MEKIQEEVFYHMLILKKRHIFLTMKMGNMKKAMQQIQSLLQKFGMELFLQILEIQQKIYRPLKIFLRKIMTIIQGNEFLLRKNE